MPRRTKTIPPENRKLPVLSWASMLLAILGAIDAAYLLVYKLSSNNKLCLGNGGCATVNYSPYSEIRGIPISLLGLLAYLFILGVLFLEPRIPFLKRNAPLAVFGASLAGTIFSAYLTYIEFYVIHAVCPFCVASAIIMTLIFIVSIVRLVRNI